MAGAKRVTHQTLQRRERRRRKPKRRQWHQAPWRQKIRWLYCAEQAGEAHQAAIINEENNIAQLSTSESTRALGAVARTATFNRRVFAPLAFRAFRFLLLYRTDVAKSSGGARRRAYQQQRKAGRHRAETAATGVASRRRWPTSNGGGGIGQKIKTRPPAKIFCSSRQLASKESLPSGGGENEVLDAGAGAARRASRLFFLRLGIKA